MGLIIFIRAQSASILGSAADYFTTIILKEFFHLPYVVSSFSGNIMGGICQFLLCRSWAFSGNQGQLKIQVFKYVIVYCGNLILSAAGLYLLTHYIGVNYLISKTLVSIILGVSYNYILQKNYVFIRNSRFKMHNHRKQLENYPIFYSRHAHFQILHITCRSFYLILE